MLRVPMADIPAFAAVTGTFGLRGGFGRRFDTKLSTWVVLAAAPTRRSVAAAPDDSSSSPPPAVSGSSSHITTRPPHAPPITGYFLSRRTHPHPHPHPQPAFTASIASRKRNIQHERLQTRFDAGFTQHTYDVSNDSLRRVAKHETSSFKPGSTFSRSPLLKFHKRTEPFVAAVIRRRPRKSNAAAVRPASGPRNTWWRYV